MNSKEQERLSRIIDSLGIGEEIALTSNTPKAKWSRQIIEWFNKLIQIGQQENRKLFCFPVKVIITDAPIIEACAFTYQSNDVVVVTEGLLRKLEWVVQTLLAHPRALVEVGDVSLEEIPSSKFTISDMPTPRCPVRRQVSVQTLPSLEQLGTRQT